MKPRYFSAQKMAIAQAFAFVLVFSCVTAQAAKVSVISYAIYYEGARVGVCVLDQTKKSKRFVYSVDTRYQKRDLSISCGRDHRNVWQEIGDGDSNSACYVLNPNMPVAMLREVQLEYRGFFYGPFDHLAHIHFAQSWIDTEKQLEQVQKNANDRYEKVIDFWSYKVRLDKNGVISKMSADFIGDMGGPPRPVPLKFTFERTATKKLPETVFSNATRPVITPPREQKASEASTSATEQMDEREPDIPLGS